RIPMRNRLCLRVLLLLVPATLLVAPAGVAAAGPAGEDPLTKAQRAFDEIQAQAANAATLYQAALTDQSRLADEITRLQQQIPALRARADELRVQVQQRSAALYTGFDPAVNFEPDSSGRQADAARQAHLAASATAYDEQLSADLRRTADELAAAEEQLRGRQAEQELVVAQLADDAVQLGQLLAAAQVALDHLNALVFAGATPGAGGLVETGAGLCPVFGVVAFTNDWGQPRSGGRTHQGTDMFAAMGTPVVAVVGGTVSDGSGGLGGISLNLAGDDGVRYYYAHLSRIERPAGRVNAGDVIGYVGDTGNAAGGPPHLHFQLHPDGGEPVNPYPTVRVLCP
ncbi:MAG: murein hydrolase activator EnvC family protein, partial [Gemmatimonadales bacterium]